jgi:hypothetical protein
MKIAFVSFANDGYIPIQRGLTKSFNQHEPSIPVFAFHFFEDIGSPSHKEKPYAFKIYAINFVRNLGYDIIIWCDSPVRLIKPIAEWIPEIEKVGVYLQQDGWTIGQWANDRALDWYGVSREKALTLSNCYACILAFDFRHPVAHMFLSLWKEALDNGLFNGNWNNSNNTESLDPRCMGHRHDQTCAELIAYKLGIPLQSSVIGRFFKQWDI